MSFSDCLAAYIEQLNCSARDLAAASHVSPASISRYLSGERLPTADGDIPRKLASGIARIAADQGVDCGSEEAICNALSAEASQTHIDATFSENLRLIVRTFGIANNQLARFMDFDPSYISRILNGERRPADPGAFAQGVSAYVARNHGGEDGIALAAELVGADPADLGDRQKLADAICQFIASGIPSTQAAGAMEGFLEKLDEFDLNDFLLQIHFDEIKVPTAPFQLPTTKTYYGIEEMKQAELDFLKAAVLSKSNEDIILYSDMPMLDMADDEYPKKVIAGMAMLVRKGVHLHNIHNVHRPVSELFMGLEGWIPLYMTGQITPYYLPHATNQEFLHFMRSAGSAAVSGEAIAGNQDGGRYVVTKNAADVAYYRRRAQDLLARAKPLMRIFRQDNATELAMARRRLESRANVDPIEVGQGTFGNIRITIWPKSHALIEKANPPQISFLVEYPTLVDALERYEPTLFGDNQ